jgi:hypothetical protein
MADKKVTELTALTNVSGDDLLLVIDDPLGTPASKKITINRLFANVVSGTTHKGITNFRANTTFTGTTMTVSANLIYKSTEIGSLIDQKISVANAAVDTAALWNGITTTNTAIRTLVSDRMQVANTVTLVSDRMQVANTTTLVNDRMQVANTLLLVNDRMQVANATLLFNDRVQVANLTSAINLTSDSLGAQINRRLEVSNAYAVFVTKADGSFAGGLTAPFLTTTNVTANSVVVNGNTGLRVAGGGLTSTVPATSNASTEGITAGTIWYSNNHLYIAVDSNTIKRVNLSTF